MNMENVSIEQLKKAKEIATKMCKTYGEFDVNDWELFDTTGIWNDHPAVQTALFLIKQNEITERGLADAQQQIKTLEGEIECHDAEETGWQHDLKQARDSEADALAARDAAVARAEELAASLQALVHFVEDIAEDDLAPVLTEGGLVDQARQALATLPALSAAQNAARDWPEDFAHENGNYQCRCLACGEMFVGHKRRTACKLCEDAGARQALSTARSALVEAALIATKNGESGADEWNSLPYVWWIDLCEKARAYIALRDDKK